MDFPKMFQDGKSRIWMVEISVGTLPRLKTVANLSLDDLVPKQMSKSSNLESLGEFIRDPLAILQATYAICKPQIDKLDLTFDQFAEGFEGEGSVTAVEAMGLAVLQAIHDFFLKSGHPLRAAMVKRAMNLVKKIVQAEAQRSGEVFDRIETKLEAEITRQLAMPITDKMIDDAIEQSRKPAGNMRGHLESTLVN